LPSLGAFIAYRPQLHCPPYHWDLALCNTAWLLVLANIEPPAFRHKAAVDRLIEQTALHEEWMIHN